MQPGEIKYDNPKNNRNNQVLSFFIKLLLLVTVWFVVYNLILAPPRTIDRPVTNFITSSVVHIINAIAPQSAPLSWYEEPIFKNRNFLIKENRRVLGIYDACNGIDLMFIYIGVIVLLPFSAKRKLLFSIGGIVIITMADIIRVCLLYYIYRYHTAAFAFSHHYVFTILMYVLIFYGWLLFIKKQKVNE